MDIWTMINTGLTVIVGLLFLLFAWSILTVDSDADDNMDRFYKDMWGDK